jgi:L-aminopeptidase/D-esterase-like protein
MQKNASDKSLALGSVSVGPGNLITDVGGLKVGHAVDEKARTGVSVIVPDQPAVAACSVPGGGPGTRETDALQPATLVERVDAISLAGGSVHGLDCASGVTAAMAAAGRGFQTGAPIPSPIVPAAILFDVANGGDKDWGMTPPYRALGIEAYEKATDAFALGTAGAGYGAMAGMLKGGLGSASAHLPQGPMVGALIAANPVGSVVDDEGRFWAQPMALETDQGLEFGHPHLAMQAAQAGSAHPLHNTKLGALAAAANTSIGVVATDADLTKAEAQRVAIMAQDGLARAIRPIHTPFDGDAIFVLATGTHELAQNEATRPAHLAILGAMAADCVARSVARAIWLAEDLASAQAYRSVFF